MLTMAVVTVVDMAANKAVVVMAVDKVVMEVAAVDTPEVEVDMAAAINNRAVAAVADGKSSRV